MRTIIELDTKDIREAIAEKYDCYPCQVSIHTKEKTLGYGLGEHTAYEVYAQIDKSRMTNNGVSPLNGTSGTLTGVKVNGPTLGTVNPVMREPAWSCTHATNEILDGISTTVKEI